MKLFIYDPFVIFIFIFVLAIALPIMSQIGTNTTAHVAATLNATNAAKLTQMGNNMFLNTPDIMILVLYFGLIIATFISAGYEGANPAVTLFLGLFFLIIAEVVSFGISNIAHQAMTQPNMLNIVKHYSLTLYIMDYAPLLNGIFIIADIIFVISKKEVIAESFSGGGGFGNGVVSQ